MMKWTNIRQTVLVLALGLATATPGLAADWNADGLDDDSTPFVDVNGDGIHDLQASIEAATLVSPADSTPTPTSTRGVVIVHENRPLAYFGYYRVSQMTPPGFQVLRATVDWLVGSKAPSQVKLVLFTYNGSPDACQGQNSDGAAVYRFLKQAGYRNIQLQSQRAAATLPASYYNSFDAAIYWNSFGYDPTSILDSGIPFASSSLTHSAVMGIATGVGVLRESRDTTYVIDNGHPITAGFPLGALTFAGRMFMNASQPTDVGRALIVADPISDAVGVEIDINPYFEPNLIKPLQRGKFAVAILGSVNFDVRSVDRETIEFGPGRAGTSGGGGSYFQDLNDDGWEDLVSRFLTQETGVKIADTRACLNAITLDGQPIRGCDEFTTVPTSQWLVVGED